MATPALHSLRAGYPEASLTFLTTPAAAELAQCSDMFEKVVIFDLRRFRPGERGLGLNAWRNFRELSATLRARQFDLAVNLYQINSLGGTLRMASLFTAIRAGLTAGRWSNGRGCFFGIRSPDFAHQVDAMLALATSLGCPIEQKLPTIRIPDASRSSAARLLRKVGVDADQRFVAYHFGSERPDARLPFHMVVQIAAGIHQETGAKVLLTGSSSESPFTLRAAKQLGSFACSIAGQTTVLELASIIASADAMITTDSGPMHIAAAVGTPLVALFGPADPERFGPRGNSNKIIIIQGSLRPYSPALWHSDLKPARAIEAVLSLMNPRQTGIN